MASRCKKCSGIFLSMLKNILIKCTTFILAIVLMLIFPLIFIVTCVPFGTVRQCVKVGAKWTKPHFGKMLTLRGQACGIDNLFIQPRISVTIGLILEGTLDVKKLKEIVTNNVLNRTFSNGELQYPELKQYLKPWMGYFFWKDDKTFDLDRHIRTQNINGLSTYSDTDVENIYQQLLLKPWHRKKPVWGLRLVTNYYPNGRLDPCSVLFLSFHHTLGDGYSFLRLCNEGLSDEGHMTKNAEPTYSGRNFLESMGFFITFPFRVGYDLAQNFMQHFSSIPFTPVRNFEENFHASLSEKIPIKLIKEIKDHFRVSFASVVNSVLTGSLGEVKVKKGNKVPEFLFQGGVLSLPGHSEKLRNYMTGGINILPIGEFDPVKRLKLCSKDYQRMKRSSGPLMGRFMSVLFGSIPIPILRSLSKGPLVMTTAITSFPGGYQHFSIDGCKCVDVFATGGIGRLGIVFCVISYVDGLRISILCKPSVMTKKELTDMTHLVQKHLDILHNEIGKDV